MGQFTFIARTQDGKRKEGSIEAANINKASKYLNYSPKKVMKIFKKVLFKEKLDIKLSPLDYYTNYFSLFHINNY